MVGTQSGHQLEKDEVKHGFVLCFVGVILHVHVGEEVDIGAGAQRVDDLAGLGVGSGLVGQRHGAQNEIALLGGALGAVHLILQGGGHELVQLLCCHQCTALESF